MKRIMNKIKKSEGFTLLEMAIVLFIVSALLLIVIPNIGSHRDTASDTGDEALDTIVQTQADLYEISETGGRPTSLAQLNDNGYLTDEQYEQATAANITIRSSQ